MPKPVSNNYVSLLEPYSGRIADLSESSPKGSKKKARETAKTENPQDAFIREGDEDIKQQYLRLKSLLG
ncbi:MAG: hypothetical protein HY609_01170 [Deltaproteobacteria bacterium]|nr:hypothetical protein [Deltaproteobacteria bacterium]MBI4223520.1 hypothetical protein [Deltaproteobacteria bacterium]